MAYLVGKEAGSKLMKNSYNSVISRRGTVTGFSGLQQINRHTDIILHLPLAFTLISASMNKTLIS